MINPEQRLSCARRGRRGDDDLLRGKARPRPPRTDEVYQANVYKEGVRFHSFKRVFRKLETGELTIPNRWTRWFHTSAEIKLASFQLISFHSTSKGLIGECGERGRYMEMVGFGKVSSRSS